VVVVLPGKLGIGTAEMCESARWRAARHTFVFWQRIKM
jgi:hypothetical protein